MPKVGVISLGCSKNRVDTESMLGLLTQAGYEIVSDPETAEILIINTCGFIESAKQESIDTILEMAQYKKSGNCKVLAVTGCLSQRYRGELIKELPEVDIFLGVSEYSALVPKLNKFFNTGCLKLSSARRILSTPFYTAYIRIADGCDNRCAYCAIPHIRGGRTSVPVEKLIDEAEELSEGGVKELTVIAQDTSGYGLDIYKKPMLPVLLEKLALIKKLKWIRVLYTYPHTVDEKLVDTIAENPKIVNYIDMPIQHINSEVLKRMNRHGSDAHIREIIEYIRLKSEDFIIRSTVIAGFPGETDAQFNELMSFLREYPIDRLGVFTYSREEGTPAAGFSGQIDENVKKMRADMLMRQQRGISRRLNQKRIGSAVEVLIEEYKNGKAKGRSYAEAPEADGSIFMTSARQLEPGQFVKARITDASDYDLWGEVL
ncbi:MAG: Ribosomal protein S12 methylthiotransferase RimO [Firmicutes bacterium ADurb.Bin182]|nr:MAG: Ribosomal protein S12 methylthiotransferase RimO [Firmicutes bacterium ADurb.Bin182]